MPENEDDRDRYKDIPEFKNLEEGTVAANIRELTDRAPWSVVTLGYYPRAEGFPEGIILWAGSDLHHPDGVDHNAMPEEAVDQEILPDDYSDEVPEWGAKLSAEKDFEMYERSAIHDGNKIINPEVLKSFQQYIRELHDELTQR